jgi:hypothetical protein
MSFNSGFFISNPTTSGDNKIYRMSLDGVNERIFVPHNVTAFPFDTNVPFSMTFEVKLVDYTSSLQVLFCKESPFVQGFRVVMETTGEFSVLLISSIGSYVTVTTSGASFVNGQAYTLGMSYNGNGLNTGIELYANGVLQTVTRSGVINSTLVNTEDVYIGGFYNGGFLTNGEIGTIRIWDIELSAQDFLDDYNGGVVLNIPVQLLNRTYGFRGGQNSLFGTQWVFPDESENITNPSSYSINMEYVDRILIP